MTPTIGVVCRPELPPEELRGVVTACEDAGVDELWLWEDCFLEGGLTAATAALAWSERVGIGLLPLPLRNPALVAMEVATVDRLFPGRLVTALGHGALDWPPTTRPTLLVGARASGREGRAQVKVYTEVEPGADGLGDVVRRRITDLAEAGADTAVLQGTDEAPDPRALLEAIGGL